LSIKLYDDAVSEMIFGRIKDTKIRMLRPNETKHLFEMISDMNMDKPVTLPMITIARDNNIEILDTNKQPKSFDGFKVQIEENKDILMSAIPIRLQYQLDIWTKEQEDCEEFIREFVFLLINNPILDIYVPYNGTNIHQSCHIKMAHEIVDNSDSDKRLYKDQFTRMTLTFEIDDAYLYSMPIKKNAKIESVIVEVLDNNNNIDEITKLDY